MEKQKISPAERAMKFAQMTRQNMQMLPSQTVAPGGTVSIEVPKTKLLAKILLLVEATLTGTHAAATDMVLNAFAPFSLIRNARVKLNNGFAPYQISGRGAYWYNLAQLVGDQIKLVTGAGNTGTSRSKTVCGVATAAGGQANTVRFVLDLSMVLNDRDPIGMILAQNQETVINAQLDLGIDTDLVPAAAGFTTALSNITVTPMTVTYSIPQDPNALPDLSVLKLVHETEQNIAGAGQQIVKLPVGNTYRKIFAFIENAAGAGIAETGVTSNFDLLFNQADNPYSVSPRMLTGMNQSVYGDLLPQGLWVWDFSNNGFPNYGGTRDLVDTERLSELWLRFTAAAAGRITVVAETLSQLR